MKYFYIIILLVFTVVPVFAWANAGLPIIIFTMPMVIVSLIPIIGIEAYIIKGKLDLSPKKALISSAIANTISTVIGIPLTWIILVLLQTLTGGGNLGYELNTLFQKFLAVTLQAPYIIPAHSSDLKWMIPTATLVLLVPFFFVSWMIEYFVIKKMNKNLEPYLVKSACLKANITTYALLTLCPIAFFFYLRYYY